VAVIKVVDADSMSCHSGDDENPGSDDLNEEEGVLAFLEKDDGNLISPDERQHLYRAM